MKFVCPKCGKQFSVTNNELVALKGSIVCPQCLNVTNVPCRKPAARQPKGTACPSCGAATGVNDTYCPSCGKALTTTPPPHRTTAVPPPRRSVQQKPVISFTSSNSGSARNSRPRRKQTKKGKTARNPLAATSAWGCLWRSVAFTAVLFLFYVLFGKLTEM